MYTMTSKSHYKNNRLSVTLVQQLHSFTGVQCCHVHESSCCPAENKLPGYLQPLTGLTAAHSPSHPLLKLSHRLLMAQLTCMMVNSLYIHSLNLQINSSLGQIQTSSSFNSILGIPFLIGNFLPDSGQTNEPSSTSICK